MGASTKISKEVRQLVTGPSALWAAPETVMGEAVRVRSKMKQETLECWRCQESQSGKETQSKGDTVWPAAIRTPKH